MSFRQIVSKYFNNHAETRDHHIDSTLETRYFKTTKEKAMHTLENFFQHSHRFKMNAVSKEHGEISVFTKKGKKSFIVASIIMVRPFYTAIDFSVTTETLLPFDFGNSTRLIHRLYQDIQQEIPRVERND